MSKLTAAYNTTVSKATNSVVVVMFAYVALITFILWIAS